MKKILTTFKTVLLSLVFTMVAYAADTTADIPDSVKSFGVRAFKGTPITSVVIPEGVTTISREAFKNCASLKTVTLQNSLLKVFIFQL